jgi:hypothetical protein
MRTPSRSVLLPTLAAGALLLALAFPAGCRKPRPPSQAEICAKGCAYRLACVDELALEKAVTDANRDHLRKSQEAARPGYQQHCVKRCTAGVPRFRAFADCGTRSADCTAYFACEAKAPTALRPGAPGTK